MKRRPRQTEPPPMPPEVAEFVLEAWIAVDDDDPEFPRAAEMFARQRWQTTRNAWCRENGFDQLAEIREERAKRRAAARLPREGGVWS